MLIIVLPQISDNHHFHITFIKGMDGLVFPILFNGIYKRVILKGSVSAVMCYLSLQRSLSPAGFNPGARESRERYPQGFTVASTSKGPTLLTGILQRDI